MRQGSQSSVRLLELELLLWQLRVLSFLLHPLLWQHQQLALSLRSLPSASPETRTSPTTPLEVALSQPPADISRYSIRRGGRSAAHSSRVERSMRVVKSN